MTTTVLNTKISVEIKIPDTSSLATTTVLNTKISDLVSKTDFNNQLISFNRTITSNKTKYLEVQKHLNSLTTNDFNFFLGRIYFTSKDISRNTFVYQPTLDTLELKKRTDYVLSWKSYIILNLSHYKLLSCIA